jgi:hypothetical protein
MFFLRSVALLWCAARVLSKPISGPLVVPRQDGGPLSPEQTVCGDIIVFTKQGEATAEVKTNESVLTTTQVTIFSMQREFLSAYRASPSTMLLLPDSSTTTT